MIPLRTFFTTASAVLMLTFGGSMLAGATSVRAAGPQTQAQMMPAQMNPGMGMGMPMGTMLPIYTPTVSGFLGMQAYPTAAPAYAPNPQYNLPITSAAGYTSAFSAPVDLQQVCHQYNVGLQYNTMADDPNLDQACGVTGASADASSSSSAPSQPMGQPYP